MEGIFSFSCATKAGQSESLLEVSVSSPLDREGFSRWCSAWTGHEKGHTMLQPVEKPFDKAHQDDRMDLRLLRGEGE
jgi:hypothetical protein